jgi:CBS domain-containing protein
MTEVFMALVSDVMTRGVRSMPPGETVMKAAQAMSELDVGVIPVCDGERLVGIVTDRDIVLRGVAQGCLASETPISGVMTNGASWCFQDQSIEEAGQQMRDAQIRRIPVIDRERRLVGMLSLGDIATRAGASEAADTLEQVSRPSRPDRSHQSAASGPAGGGETRVQPEIPGGGEMPARSAAKGRSEKPGRNTRARRPSNRT